MMRYEFDNATIDGLQLSKTMEADARYSPIGLDHRERRE